MAEIDPSIALSYRPPNLAQMPNLQVQTPLEGLARVVSLRSLMQEGQLKGLQLQQLKLQIEGAQNLAKLYAGMDLDGGAGGGVPALTGPLPGEPTLPQPTTVPLSPTAPSGPTAFGMPVTPGGLDVTAGLARFMTPQPGAPPATTDTGAGLTPAAPVAAAPSAAAPSGVLPGTPPPGLFAPPPEAKTPSLGAFAKADPFGGVAAYEQMMKARKEMYDEMDKRLTLRKSQSENLAQLINGITDDESLQRALPQAVQSGALSGAQAAYIGRLGYDSPWVQKFLKEKQIQSISYDKSVGLAIQQMAENRAQELHPLTKSKAMTDAEAGEAKSSADSVGLLQGESEFPAWFMKQGPTSQAKYGPIILNPNLTFAQKVQAIQGGAGATARIAEVGPTKEAEYQAKIAPLQPLIQSIMSGKENLYDQPQSTQELIGPEIARLKSLQAAPGQPAAPPAAAPGAPTTAAAPGAPGTPAAAGAPTVTPQPTVKLGQKRATGEQLERLAALNKAAQVATDTETMLGNPANTNMMGPVKGFLSTDPFHTDVRGFRDALDANKLALRGYATAGKFRGVTPQMVDSVFPGIYTHAPEAISQTQHLKNQIIQERDAYVKELQDSNIIVPESQLSTGAPAPAPAQTNPSQTKPSPVGPSLAAPKAGDVVPGAGGKRYKFKGGDPHVKSNWQSL